MYLPVLSKLMKKMRLEFSMAQSKLSHLFKHQGFLSFEADGKFADASSTISGGILIKLRTTTPDYAGFRMVFAAGTLSPDYACRFGGSIPLTGGCFKSHFDVPPSVDNEFVEVIVPFASFSDHWSPETGEHTIECSDDPKVCPTAEKLGHIKIES